MSDEKLKVLVSLDLDDKYIEQIKNTIPNVEVSKSDDEGKLPALFEEADIAFVGRLKPSLFARASKLKWIHNASAGVEGLLFPEVVESGVMITNSSGVHPINICEHTLAMMLSFVRKLHLCIRYQLKREWHRGFEVDEISGRTVGVVGLGSIGEEIARKCKALGMRVIATRRRSTLKPDYVDELYLPEGLPKLLSESDFVVLAVPFTKENEGLIGEKELKVMKKSAYIINIGRGKVIQQDVLIRALQEGWIAGAGLDVFEEEPLPSDSPLWEMENVIITPHIAGLTPYYMDRAVGIFCDNLKRFVRGENLYNLVDKHVGY